MDTSYFKVEDMNVSNAEFSVSKSWAEDNSQAEQADLNSIIGSGCKCVCITKTDFSSIIDFFPSPLILSLLICKSSSSFVRSK